MRTWPALDIDARAHVTLDDLDEHLALFLDDHDVIALEHEVASHWRVYFATDAARTALFEALPASIPDTFDLSPVDVEDEGWALKVQQALGAVTVGDLVIAPPWDVPPPGDGRGPPDPRRWITDPMRIRR